MSTEDGISRRRFLIGGALAGATIGLDGCAALSPPASTSLRGNTFDDELILHNGKVRTMDSQDRVVSTIAIRGNRFVEVGDFAGRSARSIDLGGRTVIPGLIESCDHIVSF